jgi:hypothetical protein
MIVRSVSELVFYLPKSSYTHLMDSDPHIDWHEFAAFALKYGFLAWVFVTVCFAITPDAMLDQLCATLFTYGSIAIIGSFMLDEGDE